ncbi:HTH_Tnp_Tc3_2 domain-containing protein [Trichonephila clavipes]|nr:HTH_Tnp_Tc3_2 domain-containing protein [Trichonephila clavipes]
MRGLTCASSCPHGGRIIGQLEWGRTQLEVSEELGITQNVISRLWQRFQNDGNVSRCYSTGRPQVTTPNEDQCLAVTAKRKRRSTASDLSCQLSSATGTTVSRQTMYRRLGKKYTIQVLCHEGRGGFGVRHCIRPPALQSRSHIKGFPNLLTFC